MADMTAARRLLTSLAIFAVTATSPFGTMAQPNAADFVRHPQLSSVSLSPDGKALAGVRSVAGRKNLMVVDLATRKATIITNFRDGDVASPRWINSDRLTFSVLDLTRGSGDQIGGGLFAIDKGGDGFRQLADRSSVTEKSGRTLPYTTRFHSRVLENGAPTDEILVEVFSIQGRGRVATNLYRLNTRTGRSTIATLGGPGHVFHWVVDANGVPRAALSEKDGTSRVHVRATAEAPWQLVAEYSLEEFSSGLQPIAIDRNGDLYVAAHQGGDTESIYRLDPKTNKVGPEPYLSVKGFDLSPGYARFIFDSRRNILGVRFEADRTQTVWFDEVPAQVQREVDAALPDTLNIVSGDFASKDGPILVHAYSDRDPGRYLLYYPSKKQLDQVATARPWIDPKKMAATRFVRYKARDGLEIPALLTLPNGAAGKKVPLVVMHYGGPHVRAIHWGWDENVQFLASRGYAVLMPAPRISTGFGARHFRSGWKQWGLAMQDDITDGVQWLISESIVDPKRVCIAGASYGGYAAMMALVKEPQMFRCGVNWVGLVDPEFMYSVTWTDFNRLDMARYDLPVLLGDPKTHAEQFRRTSPLHRASEIKQPVLMAYGGLDQRVPIVNGDRLREALAKHNADVEWIVYPDEGHGWMKEENDIDFWNRVGAFLDRHLR